MNAGGRRFTPKTAPTATKRQARVTDVRRRRRCTDVITSTCVFVIGLFLVLVLSLPAHPHAVKAAFPGFQLPTIPASSKRQPIRPKLPPIGHTCKRITDSDDSANSGFS